eukprot:342169-Pleurochrysis_carterae.AAC.2
MLSAALPGRRPEAFAASFHSPMDGVVILAKRNRCSTPSQRLLFFLRPPPVLSSLPASTESQSVRFLATRARLAFADALRRTRVPRLLLTVLLWYLPGTRLTYLPVPALAAAGQLQRGRLARGAGL